MQHLLQFAQTLIAKNGIDWHAHLPANNSLRIALHGMQAAVGDSKRHATALTNAVLTQLHLPALPLDLLADVPDLREAAAAKLVQQQALALSELAACLERLQAAVERLAEAEGGLQQLLEVETAAPLLAERAVFATLPLHLLGSMVEQVRSMHATELVAKEAVLRGFEQILGAPWMLFAPATAVVTDCGMSTCSSSACSRCAAVLPEEDPMPSHAAAPWGCRRFESSRGARTERQRHRPWRHRHGSGAARGEAAAHDAGVRGCLAAVGPGG